MDEELKALGLLALRNAFWRDFSGLCNKYLEAAEGLDVEAQERMMGDMTSIYGRETMEVSDHFISLYVETHTGFTNNHSTILEAFEQENSKNIYLQGRRIFERQLNGELHFVG